MRLSRNNALLQTGITRRWTGGREASFLWLLSVFGAAPVSLIVRPTLRDRENFNAVDAETNKTQMLSIRLKRGRGLTIHSTGAAKAKLTWLFDCCVAARSVRSLDASNMIALE
jgi:hypothetical protein